MTCIWNYGFLFPCISTLRISYTFAFSALWWSLYGEQSPELQSLAIKILSQTCSGSVKYKLRKGLSEQLHAERRNFIEQQRFHDMEFIHNNRQLWHSPSSRENKSYIYLEDLNPSDDWVIEGDALFV